MNKKNEILLLLTDQWCDWEASYACAVANSFSDYAVKTIAIDRDPKVSMGNLCTSVDYCIADFSDFTNTAIIILPGGLSWEENDYNEIREFIRKIVNARIPVAAICGAATFLCKHGFLDHVKHTGDSLELFQSQRGYHGEALYTAAQTVTDGGFITANETAAVDFAYEIFKILKVDCVKASMLYLRKFLDYHLKNGISKASGMKHVYRMLCLTVLTVWQTCLPAYLVLTFLMRKKHISNLARL